MKIKQAVFIVNYKKPKANQLMEITAEFLKARNVNLITPENGLGFYNDDFHSLTDVLTSKREQGMLPDIAFVFGGDGTIVHASRLLSVWGIALVGINLGKLGFLSSIEPQHLIVSLEKLMNDEFIIEERMLLWGEVVRNGQVVTSSSAQNDIVINNGNISRTIGINMYVDDQPALRFNGDGLVVATPTGSTAYSLSAGGPIVLPNSHLLVATPISPHNLYVRPIVASGESKLCITCSFENKAAQISFDGQMVFNLEYDDVINIRRSDYSAKFIWVEHGKFFKNLHRKLCCGV